MRWKWFIARLPPFRCGDLVGGGHRRRVSRYPCVSGRLGRLNPIIGQDTVLGGNRADDDTGSNPFSYIQHMPLGLIVGADASAVFTCMRTGVFDWNPFGSQPPVLFWMKPRIVRASVQAVWGVDPTMRCEQFSPNGVCERTLGRGELL